MFLYLHFVVLMNIKIAPICHGVYTVSRDKVTARISKIRGCRNRRWYVYRDKEVEMDWYHVPYLHFAVLMSIKISVMEFAQYQESKLQLE
jgi:hypothetical protein